LTKALTGSLAVAMNIKILLLLLIVISGCSNDQVEEFAFRKSMQYNLSKLCEEDKQCKSGVKSQISECMESSDWRNIIDNESDESMQAFIKKFYPCFKDENGDPYFEL